ncbi:alpha-ketoglutarate-dependent dioxygenase AlkB family protein [Methylocystis parvus]|uniref:Alpha-ketoglutarate-dependent dioxygenase AlkB n=1 Tax=Methylocystis parvus TaxID=134 RepID=A0A6B8MAG6_9HYPH|nr:alpha-ketoglutarate-dependent dioxygenase AlkB [Methylocystis parvus]QGM98742.1 alpha-ketoglutarate-dependent dioxygenase AlkB [Methylocystis parvus]WBK00907.1 alpha-ketoglutarate-dependent dioxygenase AlkB [Methylocystis parvus OBBP]
MPEIVPGAVLYPAFLNAAAQRRLAQDVADVIAHAPLFTSRMPKSGLPMSVRMTNCGALGWMSDRERGYRYEPRHPETGAPWPPIPRLLLNIWDELTRHPKPPEACLVNVYSDDAKMGLHQDRDEVDFDAPILSVSLGADCRFRFGGRKRSDKTSAVTLASGDAFVFGGAARLCFHGVDRILPSILTPLPEPLAGQGARVNLTLRRVT